MLTFPRLFVSIVVIGGSVRLQGAGPVGAVTPAPGTLRELKTFDCTCCSYSLVHASPGLRMSIAAATAAQSFAVRENAKNAPSTASSDRGADTDCEKAFVWRDVCSGRDDDGESAGARTMTCATLLILRATCAVQRTPERLSCRSSRAGGRACRVSCRGHRWGWQ